MVKNKATIFAASLIASLGAYFFIAVPLLVDAAIPLYGLSLLEAGNIPGSFYAGYTVSAILATWLIYHLSWRLMAATGIVLAITGLGGASFTESFEALLLCFSLAGFGMGFLFTLPMCMIGATDEQYAGFGIKIASEQIIGIIMLMILSYLVIERWGFPGGTLTLAILPVISLPVLFWVPGRHSKEEEVHDDHRSFSALPLLALFCLVFYFACYSGTYTFLVNLGTERGMEVTYIGTLLSVGMVVGAITPFCTPYFLNYMQRTKLLKVVTVLGSLAVVFLAVGHSEINYALALQIWLGCIFVMMSLYFGMIVEAAPGARFAAAMAPAMAVGAMLGPIAIGAIADEWGMTLSLLVAGVGVVLANTGLIAVYNRSKCREVRLFRTDIEFKL